MNSTVTKISDKIILNLIRENNLKGWELLYDKYAAVMYGIICTYTADKELAEEILTGLFIRLKDEQRLIKVNVALCACILRYTYTNAREELKKRGINYTEIPNMMSSLLHIFCSQYTTIKKVSTELKVSELEVKQQLQKEIFMLHPQNEVANPTQQREGDTEYELPYD